MRLLIPLVPFALLAGCGDGEGSSITIRGDNADGAPATLAANGATGAVKIDVPGFKADIALPRIRLDANDFEMNGVGLYPGSSIADINIDERGRGSGDGAVRVRFSSPAATVVVRDWFAGELTKAGYTLSRAGDALQGKTDDGKPFRMELKPNGEGKSEGTITIDG